MLSAAHAAHSLAPHACSEQRRGARQRLEHASPPSCHPVGRAALQLSFIPITVPPATCDCTLHARRRRTRPLQQQLTLPPARAAAACSSQHTHAQHRAVPSLGQAGVLACGSRLQQAAPPWPLHTHAASCACWPPRCGECPGRLRRTAALQWLRRTRHCSLWQAGAHGSILACWHCSVPARRIGPPPSQTTSSCLQDAAAAATAEAEASTAEAER